MELAAYLESSKKKPASFAREIGVSAPAMHRYIAKQRIPKNGVMQKIVEVTKGQVQPNDFFPAGQAA